MKQFLRDNRIIIAFFILFGVALITLSFAVGKEAIFMAIFTFLCILFLCTILALINNWVRKKRQQSEVFRKADNFLIIVFLIFFSIIFLYFIITFFRPYPETNSSWKIKTNIHSAQSSAELWFDEHNSSYVGVCDSSDFNRIKTTMLAFKGSWRCFDSESTYCVRSILPEGGFYCADNAYEGTKANCSAEHIFCQ